MINAVLKGHNSRYGFSAGDGSVVPVVIKVDSGKDNTNNVYDATGCNVLCTIGSAEVWTGGSHSRATVKGVTTKPVSITVTDDAKIDYVYGGGANNTVGAANVILNAEEGSKISYIYAVVILMQTKLPKRYTLRYLKAHIQESLPEVTILPTTAYKLTLKEVA